MTLTANLKSFIENRSSTTSASFEFELTSCRDSPREHDSLFVRRPETRSTPVTAVALLFSMSQWSMMLSSLHTFHFAHSFQQWAIRNQEGY